MPAIKFKDSSGEWVKYPFARGRQGEVGPPGPRGAPSRVNGQEGEEIILTAGDVGAAPEIHSHAPTDLTAPVPISLGGTGSTTAAGARENLEADPAAKGVTAGTATALTLSQTGFSLTDGACVRIRFHLAPTAGATLNVAGTGARPIVTGKGKPFSGAVVGSWATVIYSAAMDSFILQGEGGGSGRFGNDPGQISTYQLVTRAWVPSLGG